MAPSDNFFHAGAIFLTVWLFVQQSYNAGFPNVLEKSWKMHFFEIVLEQWNSDQNVLEKSWISFGPWNLVFYGSLPVMSLLFLFMFYALYRSLENWNTERGHMNK